jgi:hypothetical protein
MSFYVFLLPIKIEYSSVRLFEKDSVNGDRVEMHFFRAVSLILNSIDLFPSEALYEKF